MNNHDTHKGSVPLCNLWEGRGAVGRGNSKAGRKGGKGKGSGDGRRGSVDGCTGGGWRGTSVESRSKLILLARGVPGWSETVLLAFNLLLDTVSCGSLSSSG